MKNTTMKKHIATLLLALAFLPCVSSAALNLELTRGTNAKIPVAILPFVWHGTQKQPPLHLANIIQHDLYLSGRFQLANAEGSTAKPLPNKVADINFADWRKQGLNSLVLGALQAQGDNQYQVRFSLVNLFKNKQQIVPQSSDNAGFNPQNNPVLASDVFTVKTAQLHDAAHRIADQVYQQLTGSPGFFTSKITYILVQKKTDPTRQYSLMVANFDGSDPQTVLSSSQPIMSPAWSPDRKTLAYVSFQTGMPAIYTFDLIHETRRLIASYAGINGAPAWSPDGKKLAIVLSKSSNAKIYQLDLSSGRLTQLTFGWASDTKPSWSPDGKSLVFTSNRSGTPQIYQLNLASKKVTKLSSRGIYNVDPAFSPDGQSVVFIHKRGIAYDVVIKNINTKQLRYLTRGQIADSPSFSPNGGEVIYSVLINGQSRLALITLNGNVQELLPAKPGDRVEPAWS